MPRVKPKTATTTTAALAEVTTTPSVPKTVEANTLTTYPKPQTDVPELVVEEQVPCALEVAPLNSKATVGTAPDGAKEARMTTPTGGTVRLPKEDLMWTLPVGAKIRKVSNVQYIGAQMQDAYGHPPLIGVTARDVIAGFNDHFHPRGQ